MPFVSQPSQGGINGKKQQSISRFFAKKPPNANQASPIGPKPSPLLKEQATCNSEEVDQNDGLFIGSHEDPPPLQQRAKRARNRGLDENDEDLTIIGDSAVASPTHKKLRHSDDSSTHKSCGGPVDPNNCSEDPASPRENERISHPIVPNGTKEQNLSLRTAKYLFSSSPWRDEENLDECEEVRQQKERLHQRFVNKLGRPDSIAEIKQRNRQIDEEMAVDQPDADDEGALEGGEASTKPSSKRGVTTKKGASKLTPLEKQVLEIKRKNPDTLLVVEVGYKFRFFGEDARAAAKELSIVCIPGKLRYDEHPSEAHLDRFASASIPVHRLHVHVKRLVTAGYKVGVVRQLETAALKAVGDNRNAPFVRKLTNLYTKGTYIDDVEGLGDGLHSPAASTSNTGYLLCITEDRSRGWGTDENVHVGIVAVQPSTGDVVYDHFEDGFMRSEIETRLLHISPCELLIVGELSRATEKLVQHLSGSRTNVFGDKVRVERVDRPKTMAAQAHSDISNFYAQRMKARDSGRDAQASALLERVLKLAGNVAICLSAMITHLTQYGLEHVFKLTKYFQSFSSRSHMLLNGTTLASLEIYQNQTDHSEKGSLFWTLDRTQTRFGQRLLRKWVGRPLLDRRRLEERICAVEELRAGESTIPVDKIKFLVSNVKADLEKSLIRIYYGKCSRPELFNVLQAMQRIAIEFAAIKSPKDAGFQSNMINEAIAVLPKILDDVVGCLKKINSQAAKDDDRYSFFRDTEETDAIVEHKLGIAAVEHELDAHRDIAAQTLRKKRVGYVTVALIEYLIEVDNTDIKNVPASWIKISGTKKLSRFHTPEVVQLIKERDQHKEALAAACDSAFNALLSDISCKYQVFRDFVQALATLDCLLSLALVAGQPGYVKPQYTDDICITVCQGRHPMVEQLLLDAYVPNNINLTCDQTRALLITGPNMGGKSSYVRQVALIAIMGQIGSYVPAESAKLGILDAVFTRMGAFDNMMAGESTFMVELSETSDILKQASPRSLVILDELGRGTSTHDGVAIARAVLDHIIRETRSLTLFITHYQSLSAMAKAFDNGELRNVHMKFTEAGENGQKITFLYEVGEGVAHRSYGLNVARLATIPASVLDLAAIKSKELEEDADAKRIGALAKSLHRIFEKAEETQMERIISEIEQL